MKKILPKVILLFLGANLAACTTGQEFPYLGSSAKTQPPSEPAEKKTALVNEPIKNDSSLGGKIARSMDQNDRSKLAHALDNAPGKITQWVNRNSGISYTVTPTKKVTINGNPYCRVYEVVSNRGNKTEQMTGTACVAEDSSWQSAG